MIISAATITGLKDHQINVGTSFDKKEIHITFTPAPGNIIGAYLTPKQAQMVIDKLTDLLQGGFLNG